MITAMLNWYDEDENDLQRVISDVIRLGAAQVVAVDGAYANFPDGTPRSPLYQHVALQELCEYHGVGLLSYAPSKVWQGDEVAKRQFMLELALTVTPADGWLLVYDADYELVRTAFDMQVYLSDLPPEFDAVDVCFTTATEPRVAASWHWARLFMRAIPGMHMGGNHYTYVLPSGRKHKILVKGSSAAAQQLHSLGIYHRHQLRPSDRHDRQAAYYDIRDTQKLESP